MSFRIVVSLLSLAQGLSFAANYYVKASGSGNGASWDDALAGSQLAALLENTQDGDSVFLAAGTYWPTSSSYIGDSASFILNANITIMGGYPAMAAGVEHVDNYDPIGNVTVLSGDLKNNDVHKESHGYYFASLYELEDNVGHVVQVLAAQQKGISANMHGLSIIRGDAVGGEPYPPSG